MQVIKMKVQAWTNLTRRSLRVRVPGNHMLPRQEPSELRAKDFDRCSSSFTGSSDVRGRRACLVSRAHGVEYVGFLMLRGFVIICL